jgi:spore coat protein U-like protein
VQSICIKVRTTVEAACHHNGAVAISFGERDVGRFNQKSQ